MLVPAPGRPISLCLDFIIFDHFQDATVRIWDTVLSQCTVCISGHLQSVTCVKWGGTDLVYTASQDRTIKVWKGENVSIAVTDKYVYMGTYSM